MIEETTVQNVTRYDVLDTETAAQVKNFNTGINERLDDTKFLIQHREGGFTWEDEYDLQQWDPSYRYNDPAEEEYGAASGGTPLAGAEDLNDDWYDKYIGAKLIIDKKFNNGGNLATVIKQSTNDFKAPIEQAHRNSMMDTREFEVDLENGKTDKLMANQNSANLYSQLDN